MTTAPRSPASPAVTTDSAPVGAAAGSTRRHALALGAALCATAAFAAWARPTPLARTRARVDLGTIFPQQFGRWRLDAIGEIFVRPPDLQAHIYETYDAVLERTYIDDAGQRIMLSVAYAELQTSRDQMHQPEVCYGFRGFHVEPAGPAVLRLAAYDLPVTRMVATMPERPEPITYWMVVADQVMATPRERSRRIWAMGLRERLLPDGMLVRVSSIDSDRRHAWALQAEFIAALADAVPSPLRARAFGNPRDAQQT